MIDVLDIKNGQKIKFDDEKTFRWTVMAIGLPYIICTTKAHYTILNVEKEIRGPDNFGGVGYRSLEDCEKALIDLLCGDIEISNRNKIPLVISGVK